jgi:hypothetical protein
VEVRFAHFKRSIEATGDQATSARASPPSPRASEVQRRVVVVEEQGQLNFRFKAVQLGDANAPESTSSSARFENEMKFP